MDPVADALANLQAKVEAEGTVIDSAIALLNGLADQIKGAAGDVTATNALAAAVQAKSDALAAAVAANTPTTPPTA